MQRTHGTLPHCVVCLVPRMLFACLLRKRSGDLAAEPSSPCSPPLRQLCTAVPSRYIHAPCEADAQMVYLAWHGYVDFCISEDSDLLALGSPRVLYKLRGDGHGREIILDDALNGRSLEDFQAICILMGNSASPFRFQLGLHVLLWYDQAGVAKRSLKPSS